MANIYVSARGNLSAGEKRDLVMSVEKRIEGRRRHQVLSTPRPAAGPDQRDGAPVDNIGQHHGRAERLRTSAAHRQSQILEEIRKRTEGMAGMRVEVHEAASPGRPTGKDVDDRRLIRQLRRAGAGDAMPSAATWMRMPELRDVEDTRPLARHRMGHRHRSRTGQPLRRQCPDDRHSRPARHQRHSSSARYRPDDSDDEVDIRVRYPDAGARHSCARRSARCHRTRAAMVPISNFVKLTAGAADELDRARRRPSRLSRPRQHEAEHGPAERRSREAEAVARPAEPSRTTSVSLQGRRRRAERDPARS